jgi:glycerophosphoryl diester phosphodiesterase
MTTAALRRPQGARVRVWGHRGTRRRRPENTLAAFELALQQGADGVELDVRPCASGELVVAHDADLKRVAGIRGEVDAMTASELAAVELGDGEGMPTLKQVLDRVLAAGKLVNVEVKRDVPDLSASVDRLATELAERTPDERAHIVVSSFAPEALERLAPQQPDVALAFLFSEPNPKLQAGWGVHARGDIVDPEAIAQWRDEGRFINVWTVNAPKQARTLADAGVDGIMTDDLPLILPALG